MGNILDQLLSHMLNLTDLNPESTWHQLPGGEYCLREGRGMFRLTIYLIQVVVDISDQVHISLS